MARDIAFFRYIKDGKIGRVTINRPDVLNAFHYPAVREFERLSQIDGIPWNAADGDEAEEFVQAAIERGGNLDDEDDDDFFVFAG